jgi:hypothetical protein
MRSILPSRYFKIGKRCAIASLTLGLIGLALLQPALAQENMPKTITVSGRGTESIPTSLTQVRLGVEVQGETAAGVQQEAARRSNAVVELLRSRNVSKLQTTGIFLNPMYDYSNNRQQIVGYMASNTVSFEIATDRAGTILDDAVNAGATRIEGVSFVASEEAIAQAQQVALREATEDALEQADSVLGVLGLNRQEVVNIQVNGASTPPPPPIPLSRDFAALQAAEAAPTPVVGGEQEVQAFVTLQISY